MELTKTNAALSKSKGYKSTEVGLIPEDWDIKELSSILKFGSGQDYKHLQKGDIPVYGTGGIMTYVNSFLYNGDSVGIGRKGTIDKPIFLTGGFWTVDTLFYTTDFLDVLPKFIYFKFLTIPWKEFNEASGVPSLNKNTIGKIKIPLPPTLTEQKAIATALSDVDALIFSLEKLIAKKKAIKQGAMQQLLTPPHKGGKRLPGFSGEWTYEPINDFASITTGASDTQDRIEDGIYPFFVRSQKVEKINKFSFDGEAILTSGDGVGVGKIFHYINGKFDFHQRVYCIHGFRENVDGKYFFNQFSNHFFDRVMSMTAKSSVDSVRREMIADMKIYLPPTRKEQTTIAHILSDMDLEMESLENKKVKYQEIKQGMMQELLTGKTRLLWN
jgi:type I restriction enzyme S subunit